MIFSVITPSLDQLEWLRLCVASVRDQVEEKLEIRNRKSENFDFERLKVPEFSVEHIIQDAGSHGIEDFAREVGADFYRDGTLVFSSSDSQDSRVSRYRIAIYCERDCGMYDAVNRGLAKAKGDILSYINSDEQYLPGTLGIVDEWSFKNPAATLLFGDAIIVDSGGGFLAYRRAVLPQKLHTLVSRNLSILTCATFFRRDLITFGILFPPDSRVAGDAEWILKILAHRIPAQVLPCPLASFTETGKNLALSPAAIVEQENMSRRAPFWARVGRFLIISHYRLRKYFAGAYCVPAQPYAIFLRGSEAGRKAFQTRAGGGRWQRHGIPPSSRSFGL